MEKLVFELLISHLIRLCICLVSACVMLVSDPFALMSMLYMFCRWICQIAVSTSVLSYAHACESFFLLQAPLFSLVLYLSTSVSRP